MSIRALSWVLHDSPATLTDRLVLLAIADEADDEGRNAYPSLDTIAHKARIGRRTAIRAVERLEAGGELLRKRPARQGRGHVNRYVVVMGRDPIALAAAIGWPAPELDPDVAADWCLNDTVVVSGDKTPSDPEKRCGMVPTATVNGAASGTRPLDPLTPRASRPLPGDKARAEQANAEAISRATIARAEESSRRLAEEPEQTEEERRALVAAMREFGEEMKRRRAAGLPITAPTPADA